MDHYQFIVDLHSWNFFLVNLAVSFASFVWSGSRFGVSRTSTTVALILAGWAMVNTMIFLSVRFLMALMVLCSG